MEIETVKYRINWAKFKPGYSFFVPCVNCANAKEQLVEFTHKHGIRVITKVVIVDGVRGLRVWRD